MRPSPVGTPEWASNDDVEAAQADFDRNGFGGALNLYRAIPLSSELMMAFAGRAVLQPSYFVFGDSDGLNQLRMPVEEELKVGCPDLRGFVQIDDAGHWPQLEQTLTFNKLLLEFLAEVHGGLDQFDQ
ncbi:alpha/beta fold hydrolase [Qipengyuania flava]|uniref:alpha/beta fold hydrolase n=1 Tax=Qipengyuania flava TaxID=192812 RepID=UPI001CD6D7E4|nr:alpha/beta hydrolase [Qipengyuania flava]MCA0891786.1 alpha/beta hydrolase [Qipengyuania flava]